MRRENIAKLLGGYATGTLTSEERDALFAAALEDQQLFDALAREEPLRALLEDPVIKSRLLAGLEPAAPRWSRRWLRPAAWAVPAAAFAAVMAIFFIGHGTRQPVRLAEVRQLRSEPVTPVPSPLSRTLEKRELPAVPRLAKPQPPGPAVDTAAAVTAAQAPPIPPPPPAPAGAPPPIAEPVQVAEAFGAQQSTAAVRFEPARGRVSGLGGAAPVQDARALFFGTPQPLLQFNALEPQTGRVAPRAATRVADAAAPAEPPLGLRYRISKRSPDGQFASVNPNQPLQNQDELVLSLEPNAHGYLEVFERTPDGGWQLLNRRAVQRLMMYDTPIDRASPTELFVVFARQARQTPYPVPEARLDQVQTFSPAEQTTYVVSTATSVPAQTLAFPITLTYK